MNFFFGLKNKYFKSTLQIPLFRNRDNRARDLALFKVYVKKDKWIYNKISKKPKNNFFILNNNEINNNEIYFVLDKNKIELLNKDELIEVENFTKTSPEYRCNFQLSVSNYGFSSYQSDYPFHMCKINGSIMSPIEILLNTNAEKNFILFKNIYSKPIVETFDVYLINIVSKKVLKKFKAKTNYSNLFEINKKFINKETYFFTKKFIGVPIYISIKDKFITMEHTHPPHEYILSDDKYFKVNQLKSRINEIL